MQDNKRWFAFTIICHSIAFGLMFAAVLGDSWAIIKLKNGAHVMDNQQVVSLSGEVLSHYGLWQSCTKSTTICFGINEFYGDKNASWFKSCQIAATTATMFALTAFFAALLNPCCTGCAGAIASLNMFLGALCMLGATTVFTIKEETNAEGSMENREWGWTFIAAWSSVGVAFFASVAAFLSYSPRKEISEVEALFV